MVISSNEHLTGLSFQQPSFYIQIAQIKEKEILITLVVNYMNILYIELTTLSK